MGLLAIDDDEVREVADVMEPDSGPDPLALITEDEGCGG